MSAAAIIVAAGSGTRLGAPVPKGFVELSGRPLWTWSAQALAAARGIDRMVLVVPAGWERRARGQWPEGKTRLRVVPGAAARSGSGAAGLQACEAADPILVHDAARPLVTAALAEAVLGALAATGADAVIAAAPVTDTIKRLAEPVDSAAPTHRVRETVDRATLRAAQTPQAFRAAVLRRMLDQPAAPAAAATDEAMLVERAGGEVRTYAAPGDNLKVTELADLELAAALLARRAADR